MDATSGRITARESFDRELVTSWIHFHVVASLSDVYVDPKYASRALIRLNVLDVDDEAPRFHKVSFFPPPLSPLHFA